MKVNIFFLYIQSKNKWLFLLWIWAAYITYSEQPLNLGLTFNNGILLVGHNTKILKNTIIKINVLGLFTSFYPWKEHSVLTTRQLKENCCNLCQCHWFWLIALTMCYTCKIYDFMTLINYMLHCKILHMSSMHYSDGLQMYTLQIMDWISPGANSVKNKTGREVVFTISTLINYQGWTICCATL